MGVECAGNGWDEPPGFSSKNWRSGLARLTGVTIPGRTGCSELGPSSPNGADNGDMSMSPLQHGCPVSATIKLMNRCAHASQRSLRASENPGMTLARTTASDPKGGGAYIFRIKCINYTDKHDSYRPLKSLNVQWLPGSNDPIRASDWSEVR